jgi:hypothetical protein
MDFDGFSLYYITMVRNDSSGTRLINQRKLMIAGVVHTSDEQS